MSLLVAALLVAAGPATNEPRLGNAFVRMEGDRLTLSTGRVSRSFRWNGGHLIGAELADEAGTRWTLAGDAPDATLPGVAGDAEGDGQLSVARIEDDGITPEHILVTIEARVGGMDMRRRCTLFSDLPAIRCTLALRGRVRAGWAAPAGSDTGMIESARAPARADQFLVDRLALPGRHWRANTVRFVAATDHNDNLVHRGTALLYREDQRLAGNILRLEPVTGEGQIWLLKEAPAGADQLGWPGHDFVARIGDVGVSGAGFAPADLAPDRWTEAYASVVGVAAPGDHAFEEALRAHMERVRRHDPARDAMLMSNTWGDRSRDSRMTEAFMTAEIDAAASLGLTHVQLDDGWQAGLSRNSASSAGQRWEDWTAEDWRPHPERFPNGLAPLVAHARAKGVALGLWFNPSQANDYAAWARDADILIDYWRRHGIAHFKIDGIQVPTKAAETNLRRFYDRVTEASGGAVHFNTDVTAGRRPGYFFLNRYGSIFLENRYTDWSNYYPYRTLRNLWMLAHYVPPQWLQVEFLNVARNAGRYEAGDPLAPAAVGQKGAFAVTMAAQPLAWMEVSGLTDEAAEALRAQLAAYRRHRDAFHAGRIFPVGDEPDGAAWTGFQSIAGDSTGYLLVYREPLAPAEGIIRTRLPEGRAVRLEPVAGTGAALDVRPGPGGSIALSLPVPGFALYRYQAD